MSDWYRRPYDINSRKLSVDKLIITLKKTAILMTYPIPAVWIAISVWYIVFHQYGIHFPKHVAEYVYAGFIPATMVPYSIATGVFVAKTIDKYYEIRKAVKRYDLETFMILRDEDVTPLAHAFMTIFALFEIGAWALLEYPNGWWGGLIVGSVTYLFSFAFVIAKEVDDPFEGVWFIKYIHPEWMEIDCKEYREKHYAKMRKQNNFLEPEKPRVVNGSEAA